MAKKHFDDYYRSVYRQYMNMQRSVEDMAEEVTKKIMEPERLDQLKQTLQPIKSTYDMLTYIKYLLDMPTRSKKQSKYKKQNMKILKNVNKFTSENLAKKNEECLKNIKL